MAGLIHLELLADFFNKIVQLRPKWRSTANAVVPLSYYPASAVAIFRSSRLSAHFLIPHSCLSLLSLQWRRETSNR